MAGVRGADARRRLVRHNGPGRRTGRPTWKEQVIDRDNDIKTEKVVDKATGEVILDKSGSLREHQGYG